MSRGSASEDLELWTREVQLPLGTVENHIAAKQLKQDTWNGKVSASGGQGTAKGGGGGGGGIVLIGPLPGGDSPTFHLPIKTPIETTKTSQKHVTPTIPKLYYN